MIAAAAALYYVTSRKAQRSGVFSRAMRGLPFATVCATVNSMATLVREDGFPRILGNGACLEDFERVVVVQQLVERVVVVVFRRSVEMMTCRQKTMPVPAWRINILVFSELSAIVPVSAYQDHHFGPCDRTRSFGKSSSEWYCLVRNISWLPS